MTAADSPEIFHMPCAEWQPPFIFHVDNNLWPFKLIPILPITSIQKLWLFNPFPSSSCQPAVFVTRLFLESNLGRWLCSRFSMCSCISEITRVPAGVWGHEKTLPRDLWENQKLDVSSASPCWQSALGLVWYLWVKKKVSRSRSTKSSGAF